MTCKYIKSEGGSFEEQLAYLSGSDFWAGQIIRLVFFGNPKNNDEYLRHLELIAKTVETRCGEKAPVFSYVSQPPLETGSLVAEIFEIAPSSGTKIRYEKWENLPYIVLQDNDSKKLFVGGVMADSLTDPIRVQSDQVFFKLKNIFEKENMPVSSIVRQWNYIEQITKMDGTHQHYQDFNDSRTHFYSLDTWKEGFPAATGIGTTFGGVMIDLEAIRFANSTNRIIPLNNSLQVPAYDYSERVLLGEEDKELKHKTTPKFERAKLILEKEAGLIYISGTAAIRGENSLKGVGIEEQTRITLENIEHLISEETLDKADIRGKIESHIISMRVYLKESGLLEKAQQVVMEKYAGLPVVYVLADICRDELLVEIEGLASVSYSG